MRCKCSEAIQNGLVCAFAAVVSCAGVWQGQVVYFAGCSVKTAIQLVESAGLLQRLVKECGIPVAADSNQFKIGLQAVMDPPWTNSGPNEVYRGSDESGFTASLPLYRAMSCTMQPPTNS